MINEGSVFSTEKNFDNATENNNVLNISIVNVETRNNIADEVGEFSVPRTHFDRQTHTHHISIRTYQHKYHKTTFYQWLNKHREIKT